MAAVPCELKKPVQALNLYGLLVCRGSVQVVLAAEQLGRKVHGFWFAGVQSRLCLRQNSLDAKYIPTQRAMAGTR